MHHVLRSALVLAVCAVLPVTGAAGQPRLARACRAADWYARALRANVAIIMTADSLMAPPADTEFASRRARLGYPRARTTDVVLVRDERVCRAAAAAYARALAGPPRPARPPSGQVYVVRVADTYTVLDPGYCYSDRWCTPVRVVFDRRWRRLGSYADPD